MTSGDIFLAESSDWVKYLSKDSKQVEATTTKLAVVRGQDGPFSQDTSCPEKTGRPVLTAICAIIS